MTLWGGRFNTPSDDELRALNDSIGFDKRFVHQDVTASIAYARAIANANVIAPEEADLIIDGLWRVLSEFESGAFVLLPSDEDIHTAVERRLTELVGSVGGKLHTGRSRNDQVATDFRLWVMSAVKEVDAMLHQLQIAILEQAETHTETLMAGYTHLQPAQPITLAHWLMSFFWMLVRDRERLSDALKRTSVLPLGSGALAGTPFPIDRDAIALALGFTDISQNSLDAVSDRDFVAETLFCLSMVGIHLSRLAEDVIIYSNPLFGYITLDDRYSTGSSLMPQKRNADPMELTRGKAGRLIGNLTGLLTMLKGLPSTYNKDMQEDKAPIFDAIDTMKVILPVVTAILHTLKVNSDNLQNALDDRMLSTDLADYLVEKGIPFRQAHHIAGRAVRLAEEQGIPFSTLLLESLQQISDVFDTDVSKIFDFNGSVARRNSPGGTAPEAVKKQIAQAHEWMSKRSL